MCIHSLWVDAQELLGHPVGTFSFSRYCQAIGSKLYQVTFPTKGMEVPVVPHHLLNLTGVGLSLLMEMAYYMVQSTDSGTDLPGLHFQFYCKHAFNVEFIT